MLALQGQEQFCTLAPCFCASLLCLLREWVGWKLKVLYLWEVTEPRDHFLVVLLWALNGGYLATCEPMFYVKILCGRNCMRIDLLMAGTARLCIVDVGWDRKTAQCSEAGMRQGRECGNCTLPPKKKRRNSKESKSSSSEWALTLDSYPALSVPTFLWEQEGVGFKNCCLWPRFFAVVSTLSFPELILDCSLLWECFERISIKKKQKANEKTPLPRNKKSKQICCCYVVPR